MTVHDRPEYALVTFSPDGHWKWKLAAILVTAIVAASASLKAAFKWGDRFGHAALAAIALEELASSAKLKMAKIVNIVKPEHVYQELFDANTFASQSMYEIVKKHLEKEMAVVSQQVPAPPRPDLQGGRLSSDGELRPIVNG